MYMIVDWANNVLCFDGYFKKEQVAVPMKFKTFDDAADYTYNLDNTEDLYIELIKGVK